MKLSLSANLVLLVACVALAACNTTTTGKMLDNLQGCTRHYDGTVSGGMSGGQFAGTVKVDCAPGEGLKQTGTAAPAAAAPATPPS